MNEQQRLFLVQARSDFELFESLRAQADTPACHALHYLQMATELLAKARTWRHGPNVKSHHAFVGFVRSLSYNRTAQNLLGYKDQNQNWQHQVRKSVPLARRVEMLAPALNPDGPNPEYPWPRNDPHTAPVEYNFELWQDLQRTAEGRQFLQLLKRVFEHAEAIL